MCRHIHACSLLATHLFLRENSLKTLQFMITVLYHICHVNSVMMIAELLRLLHSITYYISIFQATNFFSHIVSLTWYSSIFPYIYPEFPTTQAILAIFCKHPCRIKDVRMSDSCDLIPQEEIVSRIHQWCALDYMLLIAIGTWCCTISYMIRSKDWEESC